MQNTLSLIPAVSQCQPITASTQIPKSLLSPISFEIQISSSKVSKLGMGEALGIIYPETQFLSICYLLQKTVVRQALNKSYRPSHSKREEMERKMELTGSDNFEIQPDNLY